MAERPKLDGLVKLSWRLPSSEEPVSFSMHVTNKETAAGIWDLHDALLSVGRQVHLEWQDPVWKPVTP
jgi:hypothetical protein